MEDLKMSVSPPILVLGLALTGLGTIMFLLSFRKNEERMNIEQRAAGVVFIGPIPIFFGGRGKWVIIGITAAVVIALLTLAAIMQPDLIGW
jgi:uncharacterized protein (TIGR00304 family)